MELLNAILTHARKLRVLRVGCRRDLQPSLPLHALQHLMLSLPSRDACWGVSTACEAETLSTVSCIASMQDLVTLHLGSADDDKNCYVPLGDVDFSALLKLQAVKLVNAQPASLKLPEQCKLSVSIGILDNAHAAVWESVRQNIIVFGIKTALTVLEKIELPPIPFEGPPFEVVDLHTDEVGLKNCPLELDGNLAAAKWLRWKSKGECMYACQSALPGSSCLSVPDSS